ncbi:g-type lectin s-receptor-like serine/threonine-protein kinase lecrk3 [Fagus crenata]
MTINWNSQWIFTEAGYMYIQGGNGRTFNLTKDDTTSTSSGNCPSWTEVQGIPDDSCAGCKPNFALPSCHDGWEANKELVDFKRLRNVDWPFSDYSLLQGAGVDEASCTQQCLDDCLCFVALYEDKGNFCWKMRYPLSNGIQSPNITRIALIKVPKDNGSGKKARSTVVVVLAVLLGSSAFLNILFFLASSVAIYYLYHKMLNSPWIDSTSGPNLRSYKYWVEVGFQSVQFNITARNGAKNKHLGDNDFINCSLPVLLFAKVYEASCAGLSEVKEADDKCLGWRCGQTHFS